MPSLYIHIPFCETKCPFCSFSVTVSQKNKSREYLDALERECGKHAGCVIDSVYVGGGTPSCLDPDEIRRLFEMVRARFALRPGCEISFEANPESVTPERVAVLKESGVNRVSLGVQSMNDKALRYLGRAHSREDAKGAVALLEKAGFGNVSVDLLYGFRGQSEEDLRRDIDEILTLQTRHVSIYSLSIEERSLFFVRGETICKRAQETYYVSICEMLEKAGVKQYEVSNFARPGFESAHNSSYWTGGEYIGLGMSAHSHLAGRRFWNHDTLPRYLDAIKAHGEAIAGYEVLPVEARMMERLLFGLRMNAGVDVSIIERELGGRVPDEKMLALASFVEMGLLERKGTLYRATRKGRLVLDEISVRLV